MAYKKKYYFQFKDKTERLHVVELWQNTEATITSEEVKSIPPPFTVEMPEIEHKFQVVRGKGCQINLLSETDSKFFTGLYHVDPTDFKVVHKIDSVISFLGYLNAEMMTEPYDIDFNYLVSVTGNDGFSLMDRFSFISADDGTNYQGIASKFGLLQIVFAKIGLPFTEYRISLSTTFTGYSGDADSSILHESFVDCSNFYDEDDKPMSLREVVDSILAPYGARIYTLGEYIYIDDIHTLASESTPTYKRFSVDTESYISDVTISNEIAIADIGYLGTGQSIERSGGVNRQVVAYSPYPIKNILEESIVNLEEFTTVPATFSTKDGYYYKTLDGNEYWEINPIYDLSLNPPTFELSYFLNENDSNIYLRFPRYGGLNTMIASFITQPYINFSTPEYGNPDTVNKLLMFEFNAEILTKSKDNPYDTNDSYGNVSQIITYWVIKVGDLYYNDDLTTSPRWTTDYHICSFGASDNGNNILDTFIPLQFSLYIDENLIGDLEIQIFSHYFIFGDGGGLNSIDIKEIWIKDINVNLKRIFNKEIPDNDIEYIGLLDRTFQNEGEKITLTCGTDTLLCDRGKIMKYADLKYSDVLLWTRNSQTFRIEELLLASVSSNYRAGFLTLMGMKLKNSLTIQNILTDTFIGAAKMMVKSAKIDYYDHVFECSLVEILPDELIIVKDTTVK